MHIKRMVRVLVTALLALVAVCAFMGCSHSHTYVNGVCKDCGEACVHKFESGVCTVCDLHCDHAEYVGDTCVVCGTVCTHEKYTDGVCDECKTVCSHEKYTAGVCDECKIVCTHEKYTAGVCDECGTVCTHEKYTAGVCDECKTVCTHEKYTAGVCDECKIVCEHEKYTAGICDECKIVCGHDVYTKGVCDECGTICNHVKYTDGVCDECKIVCGHDSYTKGVCDECGTVCAHENYTAGVCDECGTECKHENYTDGVCDECKIVCEHEYFQRICLVCGMEKPAHYDYALHSDNIISSEVGAMLPRITFKPATLEGAAALKNTNSLGFDMNNLASKDNRPYYDCTVSVSNCLTQYEIADAAAQVKIRGNYTANYAKKPYRIKFEKKQSMLGLNGGAKLKSWVLLADVKDISMTRNTLAYYLGNQILGSDDFYCTDFRHVELYFEDEYWGLYLLAEQQQVNKDRVNVAEPADGYKGTDIGYFLEFDGYHDFEIAAEQFVVDYRAVGLPKGRDGNTINVNSRTGFTIKNDVYYDDVNNCAQTKFIKDYVQKLYKILYDAAYKHKYYKFDAAYGLVEYKPVTDNPVRETVEKVIDVRSLVDTYILNEICCDLDIGWSSFLFSVDLSPTGDKLVHFEAPWDFDSTLGLVNGSCESGTGIYAGNNGHGDGNPWLTVLINEDWFWNEVKIKWNEMADNGVFDGARATIVYGLNTYAYAYIKNFGKWGFVKSSELNSAANQATDHSQAVAYLLKWFNIRVAYLDSLWLNKN